MASGFSWNSANRECEPPRRFALAIASAACIIPGMKSLPIFLAACLATMPAGEATTIMVVPVFEPLSMHGTDGDEAISDIGEALQATVMSRPMALSGAFPEALVEAMRTPHPLPSNNPNYGVREANLFVLCNIGISATLTEKGLDVAFEIGSLEIPPEVDLTTRQILRIGLVALRNTLAEYQRPQPNPLNVRLIITGAEGNLEPLRDVGTEFVVPGAGVAAAE